MTSRRMSVLRDPVHGDVYLTREELSVLDTPEMQRLRGVRQLGSANLVFPGAVHTRFDHSIGTVHLAQAMIEAARVSYELDPRGCLGIGEEEARVIRMAALVHDITHIPFGHNVEDQAGLLARHDSPQRFERMFEPRTAVGRALRDLGLVSSVLSILAPESAHGVGDVPPYWTQINSDTICADILDYLQRDAYFTGLRIAIDPRIVSYFRIERAGGNLYVDLAKNGLLREDILSELLRILEARYHFSERVYYHHAKVAAGAMIARAVELALREGVVAEEDLHVCTDASLLDLIERRSQRAPGGAGAAGERMRRLVQRFRRRQLPKRICVFPRPENADVQEELVERYFAPERHEERAGVEDRVQDLVRMATGRDVEILVVCPARRMQLKEAQTHVLWPGARGVRPLSEYAERVSRLGDLERSYRDLWKFYVFADSDDPEVLRRVGEIAEGEFPGARNVYRPS